MMMMMVMMMMMMIISNYKVGDKQNTISVNDMKNVKPIGLDKGGYLVNIFLISPQKTYVVDTH